jgi:hypothetical protein
MSLDFARKKAAQASRITMGMMHFLRIFVYCFTPVT